MAEDKEENILQDLKQEARNMKQGIIVVEFKVHEGKLSLAEVITQKKRLG